MSENQSDRDQTTAPRPAGRRRFVLLVLTVAAVGGLVAFGVAGLLLSIHEHKEEARKPFFRVVELTDDTVDPAAWGANEKAKGNRLAVMRTRVFMMGGARATYPDGVRFTPDSMAEWKTYTTGTKHIDDWFEDWFGRWHRENVKYVDALNPRRSCGFHWVMRGGAQPEWQCYIVLPYWFLIAVAPLARFAIGRFWRG